MFINYPSVSVVNQAMTVEVHFPVPSSHGNRHVPAPGGAGNPFDAPRLNRGLDRVVREHVRPLALGLLPLYVVYAIGHLRLLRPGEALPMALLAGGTALLLLAVYVALARWELPLAWAHPFGTAIGGLVLVNALAHLLVTGNALHTTNLMLLIVGASVLLLRWQYLLALLVVTWISWLVSVIVTGMDGEMWTHFVFGLLASTVLALLVHVIRVRTITRLERLRLLDARQTTALAAAAREAQQSEERFRRLANAAFEALVFHDARRVVDMNRSALNLFGYTLDEAREKSMWDLVAPESHAAMRACMDADDGRPRELVGRRKDGSHFIAEVHVRVLSAEGRTLRVMAARDITARKQIEDEREQLIGELDSFAHTVAHDLKGPLSLIVSYARMLLDEADLLGEDDKTQFVEEIANGSTKLATIIDELLLLAQVRYGEVTQEALDMGDIVLNMCRRVLPLQRETGATLDMPEEWPVARGYGPWIEEVWYNYVCNAIKYGGDPPRVTLGASAQPGGAIRFWVRDNGAGLTPEEMAQLFRPFNRLNRVGTKGYGLGLSIVQRIMERLGGDVGVDCVPGGGCEFYFVLPGADSAPA